MGKFEKPAQPRASRASRSARSNAPGKFESSARPSQAQKSVKKKHQKKNRLPLYLGIGAAVLLIAVCAVGFFALKSGMEEVKLEQNRIINNAHIAGVNIGGMTRSEAVEALRAQFPAVVTSSMDPATAETMKNTVTFGEKMQNMDLKLYCSDNTLPLFTTTYDPTSEIRTDMYGEPLEETTQEPATEISEEETTDAETTEAETEVEAEADPDAPLDENGNPYILERTICLPASNVEIRFDLETVVEEAYQYGRATTATQNGSERIDIDISKHLTIIDNGYIDDVLAHLSEDLNVGGETEIVDSTTSVTDKDGNPTQADCIEITLGSVKRSLDINALKDEIMRTYMIASFELNYIYEETFPETLDLDQLYKDYNCVAPVNAVCDKETYEISRSKLGYGFLMSDAYALLSEAKPGDTVILTLTELEPEVTTEKLQSSLFNDVLATYDSPHVWNPTRTRNLELAAEAINGTILNPGDIFSFNDVVGERTADKGYGAAAVYVGGKTEDQLGGGVCQVASTIYWCTLKADLEVVERAEHQFTPSYVPWGMDATIYWGHLDYQFRNNTAYPIRIDASVSDGYVHITLVGTETKDYTVNMFYEIVSSDYAETKTVYIHPDMENYAEYSGYSDGETIQSAYDGYVVNTYMQKLDADGNVISTDRVNVSNYDRRDKEVAYILDPTVPLNEQLDENGNLIDSTEEPTESTEEPSETDPSEEPSETDPSEEPSETDPSEEPSETDPSEEPSETDPSEEPSETDPSEEPSETDPSEEPSETDPSEAPSESSGEPTESSEEPTESSEEATESSETPTEASETPSESTEQTDP